MDYNPPGWTSEENPSPLLRKPPSGSTFKIREERKLSPSAAAATIVQLLELFIELTPLQARLLLESVEAGRGRTPRSLKRWPHIGSGTKDPIRGLMFF